MKQSVQSYILKLFEKTQRTEINENSQVHEPNFSTLECDSANLEVSSSSKKQRTSHLDVQELLYDNNVGKYLQNPLTNDQILEYLLRHIIFQLVTSILSA